MVDTCVLGLCSASSKGLHFSTVVIGQHSIVY